MYLFKDFLRIFFRKGLKGKKAFAEFRKSHRDHGNALKDRGVGGKFLKTVLQFRAVVDPLAENNLAVHGNTCLIKKIHLLKRLARETVMQHTAAQFRIHSLERDIDRLQTIPDHTVDIFVAHIGQSHIIPLKKRQPGIIVFEIQCIAHSGRHLIYEAEDTAVAAGTVIVHQAVLKLHPQIFLKLLLHFQLPELSVRLLHKKSHIFVVHKIPVVEHILHRLAVDGRQHVSRLQFQFLGDTSGKDPGDHMSFFFQSVSLCRYIEILLFTVCFSLSTATIITISEVKINKFLDGI